MAATVQEAFPGQDNPCWIKGDRGSLFQPGKSESRGGGETLLPGPIAAMMQAFNTPRFLGFLEILTGVPNLIPDPYFLGGGPHLTARGGSLTLHTDFNYHHQLKLFRRLNVLLYLNDDWHPEDGGMLELADPESLDTVHYISPDFNRLVIFNIANAPHGHPQPLVGRDRKSLALYYYTVEPEASDRKATLGAVWKTRVLPASFFEQVMPVRLAVTADTFRQPGLLLFRIQGVDGGSWTVDLLAGTVTSGEVAEPACLVTAEVQGLSDVLTNKIMWEQAFRTRLIKVEGDSELLVALMNRLSR